MAMATAIPIPNVLGNQAIFGSSPSRAVAHLMTHENRFARHRPSPCLKWVGASAHTVIHKSFSREAAKDRSQG
jgi:hypothetical protein